MERIETTILKNLIYNEEYSRKVIPFIEPTYFEQRTEKVIFEEITQFIVCILYTSPSPRDQRGSRMPSSA